MAEIEARKRLAKAKYAAKVCTGYLGVDVRGCETMFDKLYANMKAVFEEAAKA